MKVAFGSALTLEMAKELKNVCEEVKKEIRSELKELREKSLAQKRSAEDECKSDFSKQDF